MNRLVDELRFFASHPRPLRLLLCTNFTYAFVIPVIELFAGAYIIRNANDISLVMVYQLSQGTGIPLTFLLTGYLLRRVSIARLYSAGMILSGVAMCTMMALKELNIFTVGCVGFVMGLSYGFFWANRMFLALQVTTKQNRTYFYGLETFCFTLASVVMPVLAGHFVAAAGTHHWFGGHINVAYYFLSGFVLLLTFAASFVVHKGNFQSPANAGILHISFHRLWRKMWRMAGLKGLAQGFIIAAPVMLIMRLVGKEATLGTIQSLGALLSAALLYFLGRVTDQRHRLSIYGFGLLLFAAGAAVNMIFFNAAGALIFVACLVFARPLLDLAYFPLQLSVIECISNKETRGHFGYILNHEIGLYIGRLIGCGAFILIARHVSEDAALRYALFSVAFLQCLSFFAARSIMRDPLWCENEKPIAVATGVLREPAELSS